MTNKCNNVFQKLAIFFLGILLGSTCLAEGGGTKKNQLVFTKTPEGKVEKIKASQTEIQDNVLITIAPSGGKGAVQLEFFIGTVDDLPEDCSSLPSEQVRDLLASYELLIEKESKIRPLLEDEIKKLNDVLVQRQKEKEALIWEKNEKVNFFLKKKTYDPNEKYKVAFLQELQKESQKLIDLVPSREKEIVQHMAPWLEHMEHAKAGRVFIDGKWINQEEFKRKKSFEAQKQFFQEKEGLPFKGTLISKQSMLLLICLLLVTVFLIFFAFYATYKGGMLTVGGGITVLIGLGILGVYGYYGYLIEKGPKTIIEVFPQAYEPGYEVSGSTAERIFYLSALKDKSAFLDIDHVINLTDKELNSALEQILVFEKQEKEFFEVQHVKLGVIFERRYVEFLNEVTIAERPVLLRYRLFYLISKSNIRFDRYEVYAGDAKLPGFLATYVWQQLRVQLSEFFTSTHVPTYYEIKNIDKEKLELSLLSKFASE